MGMMDSLAAELEQESVATRRHLERVPADNGASAGVTPFK